ncbi:unnamed protein product [Toxocara canis]|uniref:Secreted protein n=1 Tax=Toxocara canis TaxID=6265 RepID=A0A183UBU3_TOXCA|nr:unnamed protein product [Toxocara canis]
MRSATRDAVHSVHIMLHSTKSNTQRNHMHLASWPSAVPANTNKPSSAKTRPKRTEPKCELTTPQKAACSIETHQIAAFVCLTD